MLTKKNATCMLLVLTAAFCFGCRNSAEEEKSQLVPETSKAQAKGNQIQQKALPSEEQRKPGESVASTDDFDIVFLEKGGAVFTVHWTRTLPDPTTQEVDRVFNAITSKLFAIHGNSVFVKKLTNPNRIRIFLATTDEGWLPDDVYLVVKEVSDSLFIASQIDLHPYEEIHFVETVPIPGIERINKDPNSPFPIRITDPGNEKQGAPSSPVAPTKQTPGAGEAGVARPGLPG